MKSKAALALVPLLTLLAGDVVAQWADPHPAAANVYYPQGEAPFYVRVSSYARHLDRLFENDMELARQNELTELGVDAAELEAINAVLTQYRERELQASADDWRQECIPLVRGDAVTDEQAREAFVRHDDDAWREAVAEQVMDELEAREGAAIAEKVRQRIVTQGEAITFSKSQFAKVIELGRGGLFLSHLMIECGTHPDWPKP